MTQSRDPIVIIGTGLAGYHVAKAFRQLDPDTPLVMISQDDGHFYSKPQLSTALKLKKSPDALVMTSREDMQTQLNATIYDFASVEALDATAHQITFQYQGKAHSLVYDKLVFATGAIPKPLRSLENLKKQYRVNSLVEYRQFMQQLESMSHLAILGSGLVGCEFASDLLNAGKRISVITLQRHPLEGLVPQPIGEALQQHLQEQGVHWYTERTLSQVEETASHIVCTTNKESIQSDGLLVAIGLSPNVCLAKRSGLITRQGIVVNSTLQTNDPNIYALGDCAEIDGICRQYVAPILTCAKALAKTLTGAPTDVTLPLMPVSLKVGTYPVMFFPSLNEHGRWEFEYKDSHVKATCLDEENRVCGFALSGSFIAERPALMQSINTCLVEG